jgi:hypothetical protein
MTALSAVSLQMSPRMASPARQGVQFAGKSAKDEAPVARKNSSNYLPVCCEGLLLAGCALPIALLVGLALLVKKGCSGFGGSGK